MKGIHIPRMFFFMLMRGRNHRHPPQFVKRQERLAKALQRLQTKTPQQLEQEKINERKMVGAVPFAHRSRGLSDLGSTRILAQSQGVGDGADRAGLYPDGSGQFVIGHNESWESLQEKLQRLVQDNPDIREIDLQGDNHERAD